MNDSTNPMSFKEFLGAILPVIVGVWFAVGTTTTYAAPPRGNGNLQIYFIDTEGGQSTLIVTPDRRSLLIDTGWAGQGSPALVYLPGDPQKARDANRIVAAARDAGVGQIDYLLITHFHPDHDGGVLELSQLIPIHTFVDHGSADPVDSDLPYYVYAGIRGRANNIIPRPGDRLPLDGIDATIVSSARDLPVKALDGGGQTNTACGKQVRGPDSGENPRSTGTLIRYGKFRFLDLGDLSGQPLYNLVCPVNRVGPVDMFLIPGHGYYGSAEPAVYNSFQPRVAISNNGVEKELSPVTLEVVRASPGLEDIWQLHFSFEAGIHNPPEPFVANLNENTGYWIKVVAIADGSFTVINPRTGESKLYPARK